MVVALRRLRVSPVLEHVRKRIITTSVLVQISTVDLFVLELLTLHDGFV